MSDPLLEERLRKAERKARLQIWTRTLLEGFMDYFFDAWFEEGQAILSSEKEPAREESVEMTTEKTRSSRRPPQRRPPKKRKRK